MGRMTSIQARIGAGFGHFFQLGDGGSYRPQAKIDFSQLAPYNNSSFALAAFKRRPVNGQQALTAGAKIIQGRLKERNHCLGGRAVLLAQDNDLFPGLESGFSPGLAFALGLKSFMRDYFLLDQAADRLNGMV
jgi:hypothetical protein